MAWLAFPGSARSLGQSELGGMQRQQWGVWRGVKVNRRQQQQQQFQWLSSSNNNNNNIVKSNARCVSSLVVVARADKGGLGGGGGGGGSSSSSSAEATRDKWLKLLPDKKSALYSHSLPCIEAWLKSLGFSQSAQERASWMIQRPDWHAQLSLEITELRIRYLKSGPGNLERDVERKFSYALCREDLENAILGGP